MSPREPRKSPDIFQKERNADFRRVQKEIENENRLTGWIKKGLVELHEVLENEGENLAQLLFALSNIRVLWVRIQAFESLKNDGMKYEIQFKNLLTQVIGLAIGKVNDEWLAQCETILDEPLAPSDSKE